MVTPQNRRLPRPVLVLSGHDKLRAFKRGVLSMGMTSAQAHDIILSASPGDGGTKKSAEACAGTTPGAGAPAPGVDKTPPANNKSAGNAAA